MFKEFSRNLMFNYILQETENIMASVYIHGAYVTVIRILFLGQSTYTNLNENSIRSDHL